MSIDLAPLFQPFELSPGLHLPNRIVLAPCTRNRMDGDKGPTAGAAAHYASRADAGLLIAEATLISEGIQGYIDTPGCYSAAHVVAWERVTSAVHLAGGRIFLQLWHPGRMSHSHFAGRPPQAPSAVLDEAKRRQVGNLTLFNECPEAMDEAGIEAALQAYAQSTRLALQAGFDGVEIHAANGYLPEQFWRQHTNLRDDDWGGDAARRARFTIEATRRVVAEAGPGRVGLRLSPAAYFSEIRRTDGDEDALQIVLEHVAEMAIAYVHTGIVDDKTYPYLGGTSTEWLRRHWPGTLIGNGAYTPQTAADSIRDNRCDLMAFGRLFLANPDLVARLKSGTQLAEYSRAVLDGFE
jgi:2,4-dienoyl-CoA reductase-like NADH-dependent reductase (Old Yellow Enzyme family)